MTRIIAELSSNHNRDKARIDELIHSAAECGFDAVKLQVFRIEDLFASEILAVSEKHMSRRNWEFPVEHLEATSELTRSLGMQFGVTFFSLHDIDQFSPLCDFVKTASYELTWLGLFEHLHDVSCEVIVSTGMASLLEVSAAVACLAPTSRTHPTELMHCVSAYPCPPQQVNLSAIRTIRDSFDLPVGWSDHTNESGVIRQAVSRWFASSVELHFDLDGDGFEFAPGHCWLPNAASEIIQDLRQLQDLDGSGIKNAQPAEQPDLVWRADPSDGLRPFRSERDKFSKTLSETSYDFND